MCDNQFCLIMAERSLLSWFEKRRRSKTLKLAQSQIMKAIDTVAELERALLSLSKGKILEAEKSLDRLFMNEVEIDELRRSIFAELTKGSLPAKYREDLKAIVERLDKLADHVKDAARSVRILIKVGNAIPKVFLNIFLGMVKELVECTGFLSSSIETLGVNPSKAVEFALMVDETEGRIDNKFLLAKRSFIENSEKVSFPKLMVYRDLVNSIEQAADMCADTADFIRILAAEEV